MTDKNNCQDCKECALDSTSVSQKTEEEVVEEIRQRSSTTLVTPGVYKQRRAYGEKIAKDPYFENKDKTTCNGQEHITHGIAAVMDAAMVAMGGNHKLNIEVAIENKTETGGGWDVSLEVTSEPFVPCDECGARTGTVYENQRTSERLCHTCFRGMTKDQQPYASTTVDVLDGLKEAFEELSAPEYKNTGLNVSALTDYLQGKFIPRTEKTCNGDHWQCDFLTLRAGFEEYVCDLLQCRLLPGTPYFSRLGPCHKIFIGGKPNGEDNPGRED